MVEGRMGVLWTCAALLALASAGPLQRFPREADDYQGIDLSAYANFTANEVCFSDNEVFQKGDLMPNPGPCEECRCEPPSIVCSMIRCPVNNNGCRTIQRPNHCCPDYNCECDYNGQLYNDGERVDMPEDPCQVCYCKGGEVMCNSITCYHRDDCEPKQVPGQCCPKYENCPLKDLDATKTDGSRSPNKTANNPPKRDMTPWLLTKSAPKTSSLPVSKQPATSEHTTENGNIVIVSDWLSERRTTTEDISHKYEGLNVNHTEGPTIDTDPVHSATIQQQNVNALNVDDKLLKKSETMTPLDEVIFTRIDMLRGNVESSTPAPTNLEATITTTLVPSNSISSKENNYMISSTKATIDEEVQTTYSFTEPGDEVSSQSSLGDVEAQNNISLQMENKESFEMDDLMNSNELITTDIPVVSSNENILVKKENSKYINSSASPTQTNLENVAMFYEGKNTDILPATEMTTINTMISKEPFITNTMELNTEVSQDSETNGDKSNRLQDIALENLFGLETANHKETEYITTNQPTMKAVVSSRPTFKDDNPLSEKINSVSQSNTKIKETQESIAPYNHKEDFNDNSLEITDKTLDKETINGSKGETNDILDSKNNSESFENSEPTITSINEDETTTPYFTEDHMSRFNLAPNKFAQAQNEEGISDKELTTESITPTITTTAVSDLYHETNSLNKMFIPSDTSIIAHSISSAGEYIHRIDVKNENVAGPKNMSAIKETKISNGTSVTNGNIQPPVTDISYEEEQSNTDLETVSHGNQDVVIQNGLNFPQKMKEDQEGLLVDPHEKEDNADDSKDGPPVLELNSHVPFLQLGGSGSSDASDILQDDYETTIPSQTKPLYALRTNENSKKDTELNDSTTVISGRENVKEELGDDIFTTVPPSTYSEEENISNVGTPHKYIGGLMTVEPESGTIPSTSHIPLTPADLKMLAEYLIHEKIKTVGSKNVSQYSVNPWLKGNLTSEEKIASIISAANITIGVMNRTDSRTRTAPSEISTKRSEKIRVEKPEKDSLFKGNSILDNGVVIVNKTDYLHNKYNDNEGFPKVNLKPQTAINDIATENEMSTDSVTLKEATTSTLYRGPVEETDQTTELSTSLIGSANTDLNVGQDDEIQENISDNKETQDYILTTTLHEVEPSTLTTEMESKDVSTNYTSKKTPQDDLEIGKESRLNTNLDEQTIKTDGRSNTSTSKGDLLRNQKSSESQSKHEQVSTALENNDLAIPKEYSQKPVVVP